MATAGHTIFVNKGIQLSSGMASPFGYRLAGDVHSAPALERKV
jgi:hypothetical protein